MIGSKKVRVMMRIHLLVTRLKIRWLLNGAAMKTTLQINYMSFVRQTNGMRRVASYTLNVAVCVFFCELFFFMHAC